MNKNHNDTGRQEGAEAFPDEVAYLAEMQQALSGALEEHQATVERYDREYREQKQYIVDYRHEIDPKEIFQSNLGLKDIERTGEFAVMLRDKIAKLRRSPYFARIDFRTEWEDIPSSVYIGPFAFSEDDDHIIYDWRAPISGMFYDCEVGAAAYEAPAGNIAGELTRKRQFRITEGTMEYCIESAVNIQDDVLQRELSHTSDERMRTIIATIQREQNQIIRNEKAEVLVIQGVAGSGKTSIALHRIAYLLYRQKDRLTARNVVILSPNRVFGDYISSVLPELGEEPVYEMSFADIAAIQLDGVVDWEPAADPVERDDAAWAERNRFKSTIGFLRQLDEYLRETAASCFVGSDLVHGDFFVPAAFVQERYKAYHRHPVKRRLERMSEDILDRLQTDHPFAKRLPGLRTINRKLSAMLRVKDTFSLYKAFYQWADAPDMLSLPRKNTLEWGDVYPFLYCHAAFAGLQENQRIRHLVIDEMQDYTPAQYGVMNILFQCKKTILGDFGQAVDPHQLSTLEDFHFLYPDVEIVKLHTSYRSSYEIITFARDLLGTAGLQPVERHGAPVEVHTYDSEAMELEAVKSRIAAFRQGGHVTMGIIVKTQQQARHLSHSLAGEGAHLLEPGSSTFQAGITIASVRMAKGLEFDEVTIPFVHCENYHTPFDRSLLYVACTRAMHKLSLTCTGTLPPFLENTP